MKVFGLTLQEWVALLTIATVMGTIIAGILIYWAKDRLAAFFCTKADAEALGERIGGVEGSIKEVGTRLDTVERDLAALPTHGDVQTIRHDVKGLLMQQGALASKADGQGEMLRGVERRLELILSKLMEGAK